jgi:serine/threonine protein kinase
MHRIGDIIDERYQLTRPLGVRHGAEVWEAEHRLAGRKVTLKVVRSDDADEPSAHDLLVSEARAAAEIGHPSVVEVYDVGVTDDGRAYLVTELLRGETLADILVRQGVMQAEDACQVALQVLAGVEAAHAANIVHGDLHADGIVLRRGRNGQLIVKLLDFGRFSPRSDSSEVHSAARAAARVVDTRADIQAVGAILYEMLTGHATARQDSVRAVQGNSGQMPEVAQSFVPAIPAALARVVDQALAADSGRGITSAKELASQLAPFAISDKPPSLAPRDTLMPFLSPEARRSRGMARLERAVLGMSESKASARPNLVLVEGTQDKARPSKIPQPSGRALEEDDLVAPRIPRPPRTPNHMGASVPRGGGKEKNEGGRHSRRRSSMPPRRWKASRLKNANLTDARAKKAMSPLAMRLWSAGLLAVAGLGAGVLLGRLLHF